MWENSRKIVFYYIFKNSTKHLKIFYDQKTFSVEPNTTLMVRHNFKKRKKKDSYKDVEGFKLWMFLLKITRAVSWTTRVLTMIRWKCYGIK